MTASTLNGAAWRLYRHINRYAQMSVLYGRNLSSVTAGPDVQPAVADQGLYRHEADYLGRSASVEPPSGQHTQAIAPQPVANRAVQPLSRAAGPVGGPSKVRPVSLPMGSAPQPSLAGPVQRVNAPERVAPTIKRLAHSTSASSVPTAAVIAPTHPIQPLVRQDAESVSRTESAAPQITRPVAPVTYLQNDVSPAAPVLAAAPQIDRVQQARMGQMAAHNPDMVKVPKHMSDTQVWNGLSQINDFHLARLARNEDDDTRTPWERKVVEKKPERPKKILRRTSIEEVGRPSKTKKVNRVRPNNVENKQPPAEPSVAAAQPSSQHSTVSRAEQVEPANHEPAFRDSGSISAPDFSSGTVLRDADAGVPDRSEAALVEGKGSTAAEDFSRAPSSTPSSTPSLEKVWPVQRLDDASEMLSTNGYDPDLMNLDPPSRPVVNRSVQTRAAEIEAVINRVESAQRSDSSIDFVPPTRPRPQILRKPKEAAGESAVNSGAEAESSRNAGEMVQKKSYGVKTEFGELPSDLWGLVGDQPPHQPQQPAVQRSGLSESWPEVNASTRSGIHQQPAVVDHQAKPPSVFRTAEQPPLFAPHKATLNPHTAGVAHKSNKLFADPDDGAGNLVDRSVEPAQRASYSSLGNRFSHPETFEPHGTMRSAADVSDVQRDGVGPVARLSSWDLIDTTPAAVSHRNQVDPVAQRQSVMSAPTAGLAPETPRILPPSSFWPVMRDADLENDLFEAGGKSESDDAGEDISEPSPEPAALETPSDPKGGFESGTQDRSAMVFSDVESAEAGGQAAVPVELSMPQLEQPATLFGNGDDLVQAASQAEPKAESETVLLFANEDLAAEQFDQPAPVSLIPDSADGEPAQAFGDEPQIANLTQGGESEAGEPGLTLYPSDDSVAGDAVELKIKINGDDELLIGFADSNQLSQFMDEAAAADSSPGLMLFPSEGGDGEDDFDPVPFLLQRQGEQDLVIGFADEAMLDAFLSEAAEVERGPTALIYGEQEAADEDLENPAEVHFRLAEGSDVLLGYADAEALEELIQAAEEVSPEQDLNELTQLVYGRLRHQLRVENERRGIYS